MHRTREIGGERLGLIFKLIHKKYALTVFLNDIPKLSCCFL